MEEHVISENTAAESAARPEQGFDELLRDRGFQAEFDRRVSRALETARGKWAQDVQQKVQLARDEERRLAQMSAEDRMAHEFEQRSRSLDEREAALRRCELRQQAADALRSRDLPPELAEVIDTRSEEAMQTSIDSAERAFRAAVKRGVEARLRGGVPQAANRAAAADMTDEEYYRTVAPGI